MATNPLAHLQLSMMPTYKPASQSVYLSVCLPARSPPLSEAHYCSWFDSLSLPLSHLEKNNAAYISITCLVNVLPALYGTWRERAPTTTATTTTTTSLNVRCLQQDCSESSCYVSTNCQQTCGGWLGSRLLEYEPSSKRVGLGLSLPAPAESPVASKPKQRQRQQEQ